MMEGNMINLIVAFLPIMFLIAFVVVFIRNARLANTSCLALMFNGDCFSLKKSIIGKKQMSREIQALRCSRLVPLCF
jgi:hypothetical protein